MYLSYFGLSEKPFSIAPNPQYLFLSERHKEALAHLTYGLGEAGGFVLLTGEVGTGKTTLTRSLQEQLPENTQVALIHNPALSQLELLASICDEFHIVYDEQNATLKTLTDAQLLAPDVLEQLRLLTNIETNHKKLLQIVLVGQPELQALLKRNELRQLAQRITARYHLLPLTEGQTFAYVKHRLYVAGCDRGLFSNDALKTIHLVTAGIPRLVNLLCERCLMGAFSKQLTMIDSDIVMRSAQEALPPSALSSVSIEQQSSFNWLYPLAFLTVLSLGIGLSFIL